MKDTVIERLQILIDEAGGNNGFLKKLDKDRSGQDNLTNESTLNNWLSGKTTFDLYTACLISKAFHVSVDWLLGLTEKQNKNTVFLKRPDTYGDVLIFLNRLTKTGTAEIIGSGHCVTEMEIFTSDGLILPKYIRINDKALHHPVKKLSKARHLNINDFIDSLEEKSELQMEIPLIDYGNHKNQPMQPKCPEGRTSNKPLSSDGLKKNIAGQLRKLQGDMSDRQFANKINGTSSTIHDWLCANSLPKLNNIYTIADTFGISSDWLLGLNEVENRNKFHIEDRYTYGGVLYILGHLIAKGTIGFVDELSPFASDDDGDAPYAPTLRKLTKLLSWYLTFFNKSIFRQF